MPRVGQALPEIIHCVHCQWFHERSRCCSTGLLSDCLGCYPTDPPWRLPVDTHIDQPSLDLYQAHHYDVEAVDFGLPNTSSPA